MSYQKKVTLKDIAREAGVSESTVSMILSQKENVSFSSTTIEKVQHAAQNLGYEMTVTEKRNKQMKEKSAKYIAVFCPNISNTYYATIAQSIEQSAYMKGFKTLIMTTFRDENLEREMLRDVLHMYVNGIVFTMMPQCPQFLEKIARRFPVVVIGNRTSKLKLNIVETSNYMAGALVAEHLYQLGHRQIAFLTTTIGKEPSLSMRYQRLKAIQDTYEKLCADEDYQILVKESKINPELERKNIFLEHEVGYQLCNECLRDRVFSKITAFIGNNDMVAYGVMDAILKKGYRIPDDFSVCGFDNNYPSGLLPISLTTVEQYMEDKGRQAFEMIYRKIEEKEELFEEKENYLTRVEYRSKLIARDSTSMVRNCHSTNCISNEKSGK